MKYLLMGLLIYHDIRKINILIYLILKMFPLINKIRTRLCPEPNQGLGTFITFNKNGLINVHFSMI